MYYIIYKKKSIKLTTKHLSFFFILNKPVYDWTGLYFKEKKFELTTLV